MDAIGRPEGSEKPVGRCGYQGAPGAFSHEACTDLRPWDEAKGYDSFEAVFDALASGDLGCALIPVENSVKGRIEPAASLVEQSGLHVVSDVWRPVRLALMAPDGATLRTVKTAESHPVALSQCLDSLAALNIQPREAFDTAGAARDVAEAGDVTRAAVAPIRAAEAYGLTILRNDIQDREDTRLRFVLVSKDPV